MAANSRLHNKLHRRDHHTDPSDGFPQSGSDPIASPEEPFLGDFHIKSSLSARDDSYFGRNLNIQQDLDVDRDGNFDRDVAITRNLNVGNNGVIDGNLTIHGNLTAWGDLSYLDTFVSVTSALSVVNVGPGPALTVQQTGNQPVARFYDLDDNTVFYIQNDGRVSINTFDLAYDANLTVSGPISASQSLSARRLSVGTNRETRRPYSTTLGGDSVAALQDHSTVIGGTNTRAEGQMSLAWGDNSIARGDNSIAIGVSADAFYKSSAVISVTPNSAYNTRAYGPDTFNVHSSGGSYFFDSVSVGDPLSTVNLFVDGDTGFVGVSTVRPNVELTVQGSISASEIVYGINVPVITAETVTLTAAGLYTTIVLEGSAFAIPLYKYI